MLLNILVALKPRIIKAILLAVSIILWLILLIYHVAASVVELHPVLPLPIEVGDVGYRVTFSAFLLTNALFFDRLFTDIERLHVTTMLWRQFITGMAGVAVVMLVTFANLYSHRLAAQGLLEVLTALYYSLALYALVLFFLSAVFIFRRFILYPRTRRKVIAWRVMLVFWVLGLAFQVYPMGVFTMVSYVPFVILTLFLSANVRWIAYLNFQQKLRALGLFCLISLVIVTYLIAAIRLPAQLEISYHNLIRLDFLYFVIIFVIAYTLVSILVLFFNLPTSSLFERESVEIVSFSKINQAIQSNLDFTEIIETLLEASLMASNAKAGWIEMVGEEGKSSEVRTYKRITPSEIQALVGGEALTLRVVQDQKPLYIRNLRKQRQFRNRQTRYRSLLAIPLVSSNKAYGAVFVVNELASSLEDVTIKSLTSFAEQTGIALENAQLVKRSIETERYQEQLKVAQNVQQKLLPQQLPSNERIEFAARSENAHEVGGDYFDVVEPKPGLYRVAIGDVSGKGTTAAFYMAETKGIFHALARLDLSMTEFMATANQALSECMEPKFFMTLTYLQIDLEQQEVQLIRAGHCPTFFYQQNCEQMSVLEEGTLGLGIVRNGSYAKYLKPAQRLSVEPGDTLILYTDGINEARNAQGEEFGYDRLRDVLEAQCRAPATQMADAVIHAVKDFSGAELEDDYTILIVKFR